MFLDEWWLAGVTIPKNPKNIICQGHGQGRWTFHCCFISVGEWVNFYRTTRVPRDHFIPLSDLIYICIHLELGILGIQYPRDKWLQSWANWAKKLTAMRPKYTCLSDNFVLLSLFWSPVYILGTSASLVKDGKGLKAQVYVCSMLLVIVWNDILYPGLSIYSFVRLSDGTFPSFP